MLQGLAQLLLGSLVSYVFGRLIWEAIRNPEFRREFLKSSRVSEPTKIFNSILWLIIAVFYASCLLLAFSGVANIVEAVR